MPNPWRCIKVGGLLNVAGRHGKFVQQLLGGTQHNRSASRKISTEPPIVKGFREMLAATWRRIAANAPFAGPTSDQPTCRVCQAGRAEQDDPHEFRIARSTIARADAPNSSAGPWPTVRRRRLDGTLRRRRVIRAANSRSLLRPANCEPPVLSYHGAINSVRRFRLGFSRDTADSRGP
jgi:hypothetical protein